MRQGTRLVAYEQHHTSNIPAMNFISVMSDSAEAEPVTFPRALCCFRPDLIVDEIKGVGGHAVSVSILLVGVAERGDSDKVAALRLDLAGQLAEAACK